jgi:hypothetical protein
MKKIKAKSCIREDPRNLGLILRDRKKLSGLDSKVLTSNGMYYAPNEDEDEIHLFNHSVAESIKTSTLSKFI